MIVKSSPLGVGVIAIAVVGAVAVVHYSSSVGKTEGPIVFPPAARVIWNIEPHERPIGAVVGDSLGSGLIFAKVTTVGALTTKVTGLRATGRSGSSVRINVVIAVAKIIGITLRSKFVLTAVRENYFQLPDESV